MKLKLPKNLRFDRPCIYPNGEDYLTLVEEQKLYALLNTMPVIGAGKRFSLRVRETMCVLKTYGNELESPRNFESYFPENIAMLIEKEEFLFGKQYRICSMENGKMYLDVHKEQQCKIYECEIER